MVKQRLWHRSHGSTRPRLTGSDSHSANVATDHLQIALLPPTDPPTTPPGTLPPTLLAAANQRAGDAQHGNSSTSIIIHPLSLSLSLSLSFSSKHSSDVTQPDRQTDRQAGRPMTVSIVFYTPNSFYTLNILVCLVTHNPHYIL